MSENHMDYDGLLEGLKKNEKTILLHGVPVQIRDCPDRVPGCMDPRTEQAARATRESFRCNKEQFHRELWANEDKLFGPEHPEYYQDELAMMRFQFGWRSSDRSRQIITGMQCLENRHGPFQVWRYQPDSRRDDRPCLVFIHGGGFAAGDTATVENQCKLLAQLADAVVLSIDYPLAPENPYPAALDTCYDTVKWAWKHRKELGISGNRLGVAGDSAGGTLALACSMKDRDEGTGYIRYQALIYPQLTRAYNDQDPYYYWSSEQYDNPFQNPLITFQTELLGKTAEVNCRWYMPEDKDRFDPYISPIAGSCHGLPQTLLMTAEYDFLRAECDAYLKQLKASGVPVRAIRYGGIFHGTFDRLGYAPQVEDMLREIAGDLVSLP